MNLFRYLEEATDRQGKRVNIFQFTPELQEAGIIGRHGKNILC